MSKKFDKSKYILNEDVLKTRYYFDNKYAFDSGIGNVWAAYSLDREICKKSAEFYNLGNNEIHVPVGPREWAYHMFLPKGSPSADGVHFGVDGFEVAPKDRKEAYKMLKDEIYNLYSEIKGVDDWESSAGHFLWQHYSCEWGCTSVCSEVGESISSPQTHVAFCRGASRQFATPWGLQFSFWHWGRINDYTLESIWAHCSKANGGHSPQFYKRMALLNYMGGGSHFYPEAAIVINFFKEMTEDGVYRLSPVGKMSQKLANFIECNPDVGTSYVPFGIVLDRYHGMYPGNRAIKPKKVFQVFDYTDGDDMNIDLFDMFFPETFNLNTNNESTYMTNGPLGETADVLLQGVSEEVINSYPCIILSGSIELDDEEKAMYVRYVKNGGTLILNSAYLEFFPEYAKKHNNRPRCDIKDGLGTAIIYGARYDVHRLLPILKCMEKQFVSFNISEQIDYMVNVKENSLIITLMNNSGYYYHFDNGEDIDYSETKTFSLEYTGECEVKRVTELWNGEELGAKKMFEVTLAPAEVKIFEFEF